MTETMCENPKYALQIFALQHESIYWNEDAYVIASALSIFMYLIIDEPFDVQVQGMRV